MSDLEQADLVQIGKTAKLSRRRFLQVVGGGAAAGAVGCTDSNKQKAYPNVRGDNNQIPGVSTWFRSACTECSAGCGVTVRNREGRAVKVEGNPNSPINAGTLCALGQASLQGLYDPDRIRQPLEKSGGVFKPISWKKAIGKVKAALDKAKGKSVFFSGELSGSLDNLVSALSSEKGIEHVVFDAMQPTALAKASELVFGSYGIPEFRLHEADFVLSLGADFLETWISPAEFGRSYAKSRRKKKPTRYTHVEPRLSLTGASADTFLKSLPGGEVALAGTLLKLLLQSGKGANLDGGVRDRIASAVKDFSLDEAVKRSGIAKEKILLIKNYLYESSHSLVLAGGSCGASGHSLELQVLVGFINLVLGNVGTTVLLGSMQRPKSSLKAMRKAIERLEAQEIDLALVDSSNPVFSLPSDYGLKYAIAKAKLRVSFSRYLDESSEGADLILPSSHSIESWGDSAPRDGVYNVIQPAMQPVFETQSLGDSLIQIAADSEAARGQADFKSYVQERWKEMYSQLPSSSGAGSFEEWWREVLERGGLYQAQSSQRMRVSVSDEALGMSFHTAHHEAKDHHDDHGEKGDGHDAHGHDSHGGDHGGDTEVMLYPFFNLKGYDGRAANRGWLQELPDPISKVVWDSWAEVHPHTAEALGVKKGDGLTVRNEKGEVNVPVVVSKHVKEGVVAVPIGQGHSAYGRIAMAVKRVGNTLELLPKSESDYLEMSHLKVKAMRGNFAPDLVVTQHGDSQMHRPLARTDWIDDSGNKVKQNYEVHEFPNAKDMYEQRKHPVYEWGLSVDLSACTGCSACVVACYAENNIAVVGKEVCGQGREMSWLRIDRYFDGPEDQPVETFQPMMCQQCNNAPCEPVCPVYATYHNPDGLNVMVYNRCVGTRYCSNNCSYKVRRFNWYDYEFPEPLNWQLNPDVTKRTAGVMEKCTFCIQRINEGKDRAKDLGRKVKDGEITPACVQTCPTQALTFGNLKDPESQVSKLSKSKRSYKVLNTHLNTQPSVSYLRNRKYKV